MIFCSEDQEYIKARAWECARNIAEWLLDNQNPPSDGEAAAGNFVFAVDADGVRYPANNWNLAFASMGLCAAADAFGDKRYEQAARDMMNYLRTLQIFSPFLPEHYGAIREMSPQTPWCYTRDALSGAWGFLEFYRRTGEQEYLERAKLWAEWFLRHGMDDSGWPLWGVQFEPCRNAPPQMCNDMHGSFHGGSLNFFYQLARTTGESKWVGEFYLRIADRFASVIQQPDGLFRTVERATGLVPANDPQNGLHRANDDLGTLGLLGAFRLTGEKRYKESIDRFLAAVFARQLPDGHFESSCAAIPVVLNVLWESGGELDFSPPPGACERALEALLARQFPPTAPAAFRGGLDETGEGYVCARSSCYALIVLLKLVSRQRSDIGRSL